MVMMVRVVRLVMARERVGTSWPRMPPTMAATGANSANSSSIMASGTWWVV